MDATRRQQLSIPYYTQEFTNYPGPPHAFRRNPHGIVQDNAKLKM
jgi:hypothetical protein